MKSKTWEHGFTLIELLIVIGVLGVLAISVLVAINPLRQFAKARDAGRKSGLKQIQNALEAYYTVHGQYPNHCNGSTPDWVYSIQSQPWIPELTTELTTIPVDPINNWGSSYPDGSKVFMYNYQSKNIANYSCDTQHYILGAHLENTSDPQINWNFADFGQGWFVNYVVTDNH